MKQLLFVASAWMLLLVVHATVNAQGFDPAARAAAIAPYLDEQTFAVVHLEVDKVDPTAARKFIAEKLPALAQNDKQLEGMTTQWSKWRDALRVAGAQDAYLVASLSDIPARPAFGVITLAKDADPVLLAKLIKAGPRNFEKEESPVDLPLESAVIKGHLCLGHPNTLARLKELKAAPHPELAQAFKVAGDTALQAVLLQSDDSRRVLTETLPALPGPLSAYKGEDLAKVSYAAVGINLPPQPALRIGVQADSEASATRLRELVASALAMGQEHPELKELFPQYDELTKLLTPAQKGDRLSLMLNEENGGVAKTIALFAAPVKKARAAAQRIQSTNNLKQLALAMHIYHDVHRQLPSAASTKDGKSLLSWRVAVLPYIEQQALYDEFHHDEPWDSEHNIKLLAKMPKLYASPGIELKEGHTTYLVPTGKSMVFDGGRKATLADITDGTSNTLLVVEANAERSVPWTKPDDLAVDLDKPLAGLGDVWPGVFLAAFCDGSVRAITNKIDPALLRKLMEKDDGMVIEAF